MPELRFPTVVGSEQPFGSAFLGDAARLAAPDSSQGHNIYHASGNSRQIVGTIQSTFTGPIEKVEVYPVVVTEEIKDRECLKILQWLEPPNQFKIHNSATESRQPDTGLWLLDGPQFEGWLRNPASLIWLYGGVGCGKTVLCSSIIERLREICQRRKSARICYFYFSFRDILAQDLGSLLRVWIGQLCSQNDVPTPLRTLHSKCYESYPPKMPTNEELSCVLIEVLSKFTHDPTNSEASEAYNEPTTYLVVDAMDEVPWMQREKVFELLEKLTCLRLPNIHILATSRDQQDIREAMQSWQPILIEKAAVDMDISQYVSSVIESHPPLRRQTPDIKEAIRSKLVDNGNGMFLYASLQLNMLKRLRTTHAGAIRQILQKLPKDLDGTYARSLKEIDEEVFPQALSALKWLVSSARPMFIEELVEACAIRLNTETLIDELDRLEPHNLYQMLPDLIQIQPPLPGTDYPTVRLHTIQLAHFSVSNFLTGDGDIGPDAKEFRFRVEEAEEFVARSCLEYLFFYNRFEHRREIFHLREYAWFNWEKHLHWENDLNEDTAFLRRKAVKIYQAMETSDPSSTVVTRVRNWFILRPSWRQKLLDVLNVPYFHPYIDEFALEPTNRTNFIFAPLSIELKHIRLLTLFPRLDESCELRGRLTVCNLDRAQSYIALSHTWGSFHDTADIYLEGTPLLIAGSLRHALVNLRSHHEFKLPHLWVDMISVDQRNMEERSQQVGLMPAIYARAQEVVIYLGEKEEHDAIVVNYLKELASICSADFGNTGGGRLFPGLTDLVFKISQAGGWSAILDFFSRPWWRRCWIIQEIVFATSATVVVGNLSLNFDVVDRIMRCRESIEETLSVLPNVAISIESHPGWRAATSLSRTRKDFLSGILLTLPGLLYGFSGISCGDPRDRVYSLLSLVPTMSHKIIPDWSKSKEEVYSDAALKTIQTYHNLDILSLCSSVDRPEMLSWVPDFSSPSAVIPLAPGIMSLPNSLDLFAAGGHGSKAHIYPNLDWTVLSLRGIRFDVIETISILLFQPGLFPRPAVGAFFRVPAGQSRVETLWRTLVADQWHQGQRLKREKFGQSTIPPLTEKEEETLLNEPGLARRMKFLSGRSLFVTTRGYLGLGRTESIKCGDAVVVMEGGAVPYVLRDIEDSDGEQTFQGECYVHGIMDGEVPAALQEGSGEYNLERFSLR